MKNIEELNQAIFRKELTGNKALETKCRDIITQWAKTFKGTGKLEFGKIIEINSIAQTPIYEIKIYSQFEKRQLNKKFYPFKGEELEEYTLSSTQPVDIWAFKLQKVDEFVEKNFNYVVSGSKKAVICTKCEGDKEVICHICSGTKIMTCLNCKGTTQMKCRTCNGTSKKTCKTCNGHGNLPTQSYRCLSCSGTGTVYNQYVPGNREKCKSCGGKGSVVKTPKCTSCGGTGYVKCPTCHGKKTETCIYCNNGKKSCIKCKQTGKLTCQICDGYGKIVKYLEINQQFYFKNIVKLAADQQFLDTYSNIRSEIKINNSNPILNIRKKFFTPTIISETGAFSTALTSITNEFINTVNTEQAFINFQQLLICMIDILDIKYSFKGKDYSIALIGENYKVYATNSPISEKAFSFFNKALGFFKSK
jgi:hypothetical protein